MGAEVVVEASIIPKGGGGRIRGRARDHCVFGGGAGPRISRPAVEPSCMGN